MNPFIFPALIVLCLCGTSTVSVMKDLENRRSSAILTIFPVWFAAASALVAIALASLTGKGVWATLPTGIALGFLSTAFAGDRMLYGSTSRSIRSCTPETRSECIVR